MLWIHGGSGGGTIFLYWYLQKVRPSYMLLKFLQVFARLGILSAFLFQKWPWELIEDRQFFEFVTAASILIGGKLFLLG